jgi:putative transposase
MKHRQYQYILRPTEDQRKTLESFGSASRWIWNHFLFQNIEKHKNCGEFIFKHEMIISLPKLKEECEWLKAIPSQALQQKCMDLDVAIGNCFKRGFGFPKFKSKRHQTDSFRIPQSSGKNKHIKITNKSICIPKIGKVKWIKHRPLDGRVKSITIKQIGKDWYVTVLCEQIDDVSLTEIDTDQILGLDFGLGSFITDSNGNKIESPKVFRKNQLKLKAKQRRLSRCDKGSKRRNKNRIRVAKLYRKVANIRKDFLHKLSRSITKTAKIVGIEDLNIKGMSRNKHLSKSIFDSGWSYFTMLLNYKMREVGGDLIKIDRFYPSTKTCSSCGNEQLMPLNVRTYQCGCCGMEMDRDHNAAINIRQEAINQLYRTGTVRIKARGDSSAGISAYDEIRYEPMKREKFREIRSRKPRVL